MFKKVIAAAAVVLTAGTLVNAAQARDISFPFYSNTCEKVTQCVGAAKDVEGRRMCYSEASDWLYEKSEKEYKAALEACKLTDNASVKDCTAAVKKVHDTYVSYYDQMMVVLTSLNAQANKESMAETEELMLNVTANHALLLEQAVKTSKAAMQK